MGKTTKNLLVISIVAFVSGLAFVFGIVNVKGAVALYVALPLGAVFFGLFLIFRMLEKEVSLYDDEQRAHSTLKKEAVRAAKMSENPDRGCPSHKASVVR